MNKTLLLTTLLLGASSSAFSEETEKKRNWSGTGQLGFTSASGNSESETLNAGLSIKIETGKWVSDMGLALLHASSNDVDTASRYTLTTKTGYKFNEKNYFYYASRYENDNFSGFDYVASNGFGWGHKFEDTDTARLITELGIGYKTEALDVDRSKNTGAVFLGKLDYMRQVTDTTSFENLLTVEAADFNTFIQNDAGFAFTVSDKFKVKLAHQYRHNTDVPAGKDKTDTLVSANLVYDF